MMSKGYTYDEVMNKVPYVSLIMQISSLHLPKKKTEGQNEKEKIKQDQKNIDFLKMI